MASVYVAGGSSEAELCASWMQRLRDAGHTIAVDWVANIRAVGDANPREASENDRYRWTEDDLDGASDADVFWLLVPEKPSIGCWVELGWCSRVSGAQIIVSGDWRKSIFTSLADARYDTHDEAFAAIVGQREAAQ